MVCRSNYLVLNLGLGFVMVTAKKEHKAKAEGDLAFKKGDAIGMFFKIDSTWALGEAHGEVGRFPLALTKEVAFRE